MSSAKDYAKPQAKQGGGAKQVTVKVGMVGDSQVGKTSLMVKYVDGSFDEDYIQTLGTYPFFFFYIYIYISY